MGKNQKDSIICQRFTVIHIAKLLEKATARPKLVKEYACPNALADRQKQRSTGYNKVYKSLGKRWLN